MKIEMSFVLLSALSIVGCGRDATVTDYKLAGVGLNPEEIAPEPENYIGFVSYDLIDFSGGTLPLGLVGLVSFRGAGPELGTYDPPYSMVFGSGFFFASAMPAPDVLFGSFGTAPSKIGKCHTVFEPNSYLSGVADGGSSIDLFTEAGDGYSIGRRPLAYPPNPSKVFPYYTSLETYKSANRSWRNPVNTDTTDLSAWNPEEVSVNNFPFGENVSFSFKGAIAAEELTVGTIPQPYNSSVMDGETHSLPTKSRGVMVSWTGTKYSGDGLVTDDGAQSVCMQFSTSGETPTTTADCIDVIEVEAPAEGQYDRGQMYTGPWDTESGVKVQWIPSTAGINETVSISVRFLGEIDEEDDSFIDEVVMVSKTADAQIAWDGAISSGLIPEGAECPEEGSRPALPCDEFVAEFDPSLRRGDGYIPSMQGNPLNNLVETTCAVDDAAGEFVITEEILEDAITYAKQHNAAGAIFYFNRTTKTPFSIPEVRDAYGAKKEAGEMLVVSNSVQIGRFWVQDGTF